MNHWVLCRRNRITLFVIILRRSVCTQIILMWNDACTFTLRKHWPALFLNSLSPVLKRKIRKLCFRDNHQGSDTLVIVSPSALSSGPCRAVTAASGCSHIKPWRSRNFIQKSFRRTLDKEQQTEEVLEQGWCLSIRSWWCRVFDFMFSFCCCSC